MPQDKSLQYGWCFVDVTGWLNILHHLTWSQGRKYNSTINTRIPYLSFPYIDKVATPSYFILYHFYNKPFHTWPFLYNNPFTTFSHISRARQNFNTRHIYPVTDTTEHYSLEWWGEQSHRCQWEQWSPRLFLIGTWVFVYVSCLVVIRGVPFEKVGSPPRSFCSWAPYVGVARIIFSGLKCNMLMR